MADQQSNGGGFTGVLRKMFPFISLAATAGGPLGTMAASALGQAIGANKVSSSDPADIAKALTLAGADPATLAAAQKAEADFKVQMAQLGFQNEQDLEKIAADDRASARAREMTVRDKVPAALALLITCGFFGLLFYMMKYQPPAANKDLLNIMLGSLGTAWMMVVAYYFGSSIGSDRKTEVLANVAGAAGSGS